MFDIVFKQLLEDQQRSDRSILYAQYLGNPMYAALHQAYDVFTKNLDPQYLEDLTNALSITDGIYAQMGVELGL